MKNIFLAIYFIVLVFLTYEIIHLSNEKQQLRYELAELNSIKYGLFDIEQWKDKIAEIIIKKIDEYEITPENKEYIKGHIEAGFYKLLDELSLFLEQEQIKGNWFEQIVKTVTYGVVFDKESFKSQVPLWAEEVMKLIENPDTKQQLKEHLKNRIVQLINNSKSVNENAVLNKILFKYSYSKEDKEQCANYVDNIINSLNSRILIFSTMLIILCLTPFLIEIFVTSQIENLILFKVLSLIALLAVGISIPMLSIDVRIDNFDFILIGEKITFQNQTLYFQNKSILQVIRAMLSSLKFKAIITGVFIFIFSVVFPFTKLSCIIYESFTASKTSISDFFISKTSKWSMADVMVVAIFLSFLGINSFLNDLLKITESTKEYLNVVPNNNHSFLEIGIIFFILFVLLSLLTKPQAIIKSETKFGKTF